MNKEHLSVVLLGHHNSGKSTAAGHLLYKVGAIDQRSVDRFEQEASELGKPPAAKYTWITDRLKAERDRETSMDVGLNQVQTQKYMFTMLDAPGHRDYIKNTIGGTAQADVMLLVVSARTGEFEAGIVREGQTREHALLAFTFGITQLAVVVTKMDDPEVNFSQARYDDVVQQTTAALGRVGYPASAITFVPLSGYTGDNIIERSSNMPWHEGPTLFDALNAFKPPVRQTDRPLRIPLQNVYKIGGIGTVPVGRIESGTVCTGDQLAFAPGNRTGKAKSIEMHHMYHEEATTGDNVGICVKGLQPRDLGRGFVCGRADDDPPLEAESFIAQVVVLNHPGRISNGYAPTIDCHTCHVSCTFEEIIATIDRRSGEELVRAPKSIKSGDAALVKMVPRKPMVVEAFSEYASLGRFAVRDMRQTVAVGIIKSVVKKAPVDPEADAPEPKK